jgi:transposase InsO family protein
MCLWGCQAALGRKGIIPSMSRKGDCWNNVPKESFLHTLNRDRKRPRLLLPPLPEGGVVPTQLALTASPMLLAPYGVFST